MATMAHPSLSPPPSAPPHAHLNPTPSHPRSAYTNSGSPVFRRRPPQELFQPPSILYYEHFSALRSTHQAPSPTTAPSMFQPACDSTDDCAFTAANTNYDCQECAQDCADDCTQRQCDDGSCTLPFTPQCTDQCIVVACSDEHHDVSSCEPFAAAQPCGKECPGEQCPGEFDCTVFDQLFQCCNEYHFDHSDMRNYVPQAGSTDYSFMTDQAIDFQLSGSSQPPVIRSQDPLSFPPLDSATSTPQLVPSPAFESSPSPFSQPRSHNTLPSPSIPALPAPTLHTRQPAPVLQCKWSGCFATFNSLSDLVGHVNLQHLRLPSTAASLGISYLTPPTADRQHGFQPQQPDMDSLACLWGDCQVYPSSQSVPGPSSGNSFNLMDMLVSHLLQDHLGLSMRTPSFPTNAHDGTHPPSHHHAHPHPHPHTPTLTPPDASPSTTASDGGVPLGGPPTPVPEHDCSNDASHVCRWSGCGQSFAACDALTEHIASAHIGSGRAHYDCFWEGCARNGDNGFASKQKISRHMQSHTGHRPFQCGVCSQNFSEAATLAQHMRRHTQEKPYACDFPGCGKAFAIAGALTIHKRTHNGSKPFKCTYCGR
ncbi:transcription factor [Ganoderma sinense ZZ0214-1]|uniref:Transcription factor n=1 Tax=Ganoderma sinense ZZ0214-1 TaxID=1077348 RepID=A0A2G8RU41_9APHY|nr:transcription factor [Ganoderma sinense ZZ0214-1]